MFRAQFVRAEAIPQCTGECAAKYLQIGGTVRSGRQLVSMQYINPVVSMVTEMCSQSIKCTSLAQGGLAFMSVKPHILSTMNIQIHTQPRYAKICTGFQSENRFNISP